MSLRLSICLPVYNFGAFLGETLDSILPQAVSDVVEVVVIDGASTDDTADVVAGRQAQWPQLRYVRLARRGGIDVDMALSVDNARADWCWLFSGDDIMRPGAVARALEWLDAGDDVLICRHADCDKQMRFLGERAVMRTEQVWRLDFEAPEQRRKFLQDAVTTEALFSFMSGLVIRRAAWLSVPAVDEFTGSCWGHVARLLTVANHHLRVCYVGEVWLDKRAENDSFMDRGIVNRIRIAVDGYTRLAARFYGEQSVEAAQVRRFLRNELTIVSFMAARQACVNAPELESKRELDRMLGILYRESTALNLLTRVAYYCVPLSLYGLLRRILKAARWR